MLHALAIKQIVVKWPLVQEPPLHFPQVVFLAGLCMYCFVRFGSFQIEDSNGSSFVAAEFPELELDRMDVSSALTELSLPAKSGRPVPIAYNSSFQDLLVVLESKRHSTISSQLARRLRAAIDRISDETLPDALFNSFAIKEEDVQLTESKPPSQAVAHRIEVYDVNSAEKSQPSNLLGQKRKRSQLDNDLGQIKDHQRTNSLRPKDSATSANRATQEKPPSDFPTCVACSKWSKLCTKPWRKKCEYCFRKGIGYVQQLRPLGLTAEFKSRIRDRKVEPAECPCRRYIQTSSHCIRSHRPSAPCDNCCCENRYCYDDTTGVNPPAQNPHEKQYKVTDAVLENDEAHDQDEYTDDEGFENYNGDQSGDDADSDTIMVSSARGITHSGSMIKPEPKPCRRRYREGIVCYRPDGPDSLCKRYVTAQKTTCNPDLTGVRPHPRTQKSRGSPVEAQRPSRQKGKEKPHNNLTEARILSNRTFNHGVWSEPVPCRRCYYDGRRCYRDRGKDQSCHKCFRLGMNCNTNLTGIKPYVRRQHAGGPQRPNIYRYQSDDGSAPDLAFDHDTISIKEVDDMNLQDESAHEDEGFDADATDDDERSGQVAATRYRDYGVQDGPQNTSARAQFRRTEAMNIDFMATVGEKWSLDDMQSNDPLVIWSDWLPKSKLLPSRCPPEPRPCRKCFYEGYFRYKSRGRDEGCDSYRGRTTCNSDLMGVIPYRYKRAKIQERQGLVTPLLRQRVESQARKLRATKSNIGMADVEKSPTFIEIEDDGEQLVEEDSGYNSVDDVDDGLDEDFVRQQEADGVDPLVIYKEYVPKVGTRAGINPELRPCRACFINGQNCYKKLGP